MIGRDNVLTRHLGRTPVIHYKATKVIHSHLVLVYKSVETYMYRVATGHPIRIFQQMPILGDFCVAHSGTVVTITNVVTRQHNRVSAHDGKVTE